MYPLWDMVIAPLLQAAGARRVVEVGALQGETTVKMLRALGPEAEVDVIDPVPQFDPSDHERRFPGRYHFHRDISHNVLPDLPPVDAALIDGDHNWYTVYNELKLLAATARKAGTRLPIVVLHDVGWPYGRRDLYYAPERIPEKFRQPYAQKGIRLRGGAKGQDDLLERGGFNPRMNNALHEGGARNGVMTAVEDFVAEYEGALRLRVVPIYFGLAILAEEEQIASLPELAEAFERLDDPQFLRELLELSEQLRIREMHWGQVVFYRWQDRLDAMAERYLALLRASLDDRPETLDQLMTCLNTIRADKVKGDFIQCGVAGRDGAILMRAFAKVHQMEKTALWLTGNGPAAVRSLEDVRSGFERFELLDERVNILPGPFPSGLDQAPIQKAALVRVGADAPPGEALALVYDKLAVGGFVLVEDCSAPKRREAIERFRTDRGIDEPLESDQAGALAGWRKMD
jgi:Macrocin-O-methyltransferase (TylF)/Methyltransferase domain